jgi:sulfite reductase (NADPH) flavoprotein alpha-component
VAETLDMVLAPLQLSVSTLKAKERYAEDVF